MKEKNQLISYLRENGKTHSWRELAEMFNFLPNSTNKQKSDAVRRLYNNIQLEPNLMVTVFEPNTPNLEEEFEEFLKWKKQTKGRKKKEVTSFVPPYLGGNPDNVLVIGDIHEPFCIKGYLEFCREQQEKYNCGTIVFIGDVVDFHYSSFHNSDPDGFSAGDELERAIGKLQNWHYTFPHAVVTIGNHDRIIARKLYSSGISARFAKPLHDVLNCPTWRFAEEYEYNDVLYIHGEAGTAKKKSADEGVSVVQGHHHTEAYVDFSCGRKNQRFAMQVGTGIDFEAYAFGYAQRGKKPLLSCGIVLEGKYPILVPFN